MRGRGEFIGVNVTPAASAVNSAASGVWTLREAEALRRARTWPFVAPGGVATGLQAWYDASDSATLFDATSGGSLVAADGGVARWEDKSGNARHMTQSVSVSRPLRKTAVQNGLGVLRFDGSNDFMSIASSTGAFAFLHGGSTGYSVFAVGKQASATNHFTFLNTGVGGSPSGDSGQLGFMLAILSSLRRYVAIRNGVADVATVSPVATVTQNQFYALSVVGTPNSGTASARAALRTNGGSADTNGSTGGSSTSNASRDAVLGRYVGYPGAGGAPDSDQYSNGDMCEIIIYNTALSDANRALVESYLLAKWGIT